MKLTSGFVFAFISSVPMDTLCIIDSAVSHSLGSLQVLCVRGTFRQPELEVFTFLRHLYNLGGSLSVNMGQVWEMGGHLSCCSIAQFHRE